MTAAIQPKMLSYQNVVFYMVNSGTSRMINENKKHKLLLVTANESRWILQCSHVHRRMFYRTDKRIATIGSQAICQGPVDGDDLMHCCSPTTSFNDIRISESVGERGGGGGLKRA